MDTDTPALGYKHNGINWVPKKDRNSQTEKFKVQAVRLRDFPAGPVVKTSSSSTGGVGSISTQGSKIPLAL